jgi:hypothetical protein
MMAQEIHICAAPLPQQPQQIAQESRHVRKIIARSPDEALDET